MFNVMGTKGVGTQYEPVVGCEETSSYNSDRIVKMKPNKHSPMLALPRYYRRHYRHPAPCCQQRPTESNKKIHQLRLCRKKIKKNLCCMEETTSVDEKSVSSYTSELSVDVSQEMAAVNRDIEEIIRKCDKYCGNEYSRHHLCDHKPERLKQKNGLNYFNTKEKLTTEQLRILSMDKPPLEKLKDIPVAFLKPRPPPHRCTPRPFSAHHKNVCATKEMNNLVDETDMILKNVYDDLIRSKLNKKCQGCSTKSVFANKPATCLERYLGCESKFRSPGSRWQEVLTSIAHVHDTNCIENPTCKRCFKQTVNTVPRHNLTEKGVNTVDTETSHKIEKSEIVLRKKSVTALKDPPTKQDKGTQNSIDCTNESILVKELAPHFRPLQNNLRKDYVAYNLTVERGIPVYREEELSKDWRSKQNKNSQVDSGCSDQPLSGYSDQSQSYESNSLLLNRNINLNLDTSGHLVQDSHVDAVIFTQKIPSNPTAMSLQELNESGNIRLPGGGDNKSMMQNPHSFISKVISQIVMRDHQSSNENGTIPEVKSGSVEKIDTGLCIEIIRRLTELMLEKPAENFNKQTLTSQLNKLKQLRTDFLRNIEKEIKKIEDLDIYLGSIQNGKQQSLPPYR